MLSPFLFYVPMMLAVLVWNAVVCAVVFRRRRNWPWRLRYAQYFTPIRCAVYFGQEENDGELYRLVCGPTSNADAAGFSFYSLCKTREEMDERLARVASWVEEFGQDKEHWVFEFGQSSLTMGGERAQSHYIQWLTRWTARQPQFTGTCVFALGDYEEKMGLINSQGRKRPAYNHYRRLLTALSRQSEKD